MFPNTPHCELAVLFERVEAVVPEKVEAETLTPEIVSEDILPAVDESDEIVV